MVAIWLIREAVSLELVALDRSWLSFARREGWLEMWTLLGRDAMMMTTLMKAQGLAEASVYVRNGVMMCWSCKDLLRKREYCR